MLETQRISDHAELRRTRGGAVIDVDTDAYKRYIKIKQHRQQQNEKVESMETRINNMESDIADIKNLLIRLLEK
jgi:hypothetical protein